MFDKLYYFLLYFRQAVLTFDAMAIKPGFQYSSSTDSVQGFTSLNSQSFEKPADHLLAIVLRGVSRNWKQIIGYILHDSQFNANCIHAIFSDSIKAAEEAKIKVIAITCDLEINQQKLSSILNVTPLNSSINSFTNYPIYFIFDPPHLLKCLRNNLMNYNIQFSPNKFASWKYIKQLWHLENLRPTKLAPKLSSSHIFLRVGKK